MTNTRETIDIFFAGAACQLDARGAAYFPKHHVLVVSDLHLEKASFLKTFANPIPHYDTQDTLLRLQQLVEDYAPHTLLCLGDSFHDAKAVARLNAHQISSINNLCNKVERWIWVLGNHDPDIAIDICGQRMHSFTLEEVLFTHEPQVAKQPQIIGHFHPKLTRHISKQRISGKCFVVGKNCLLMPSFGTFTGGLDISHVAIQSVLGEQPFQPYLLYNQKIWKINV